MASFGDKLLAGGVAGIVGTTAIFPIDLVKTRLQNYKGTERITGVRMGHMILKAEGLRGMYRGLLANLVGVTPEKAIKLAANDYFRSLFAKQTKVDNLPAHLGMLSGALAGLCQVVATNPMETVKIQMQMRKGTSSTWTVIRELGLKGMYKGTSATLSRDIPFSMMFFQLSSTFKQCFKSPETGQISFAGVFASSLAAGAIAAFFATPMDVVKTRLQAGVYKSGLIDAYRMLYRNEGLKAFFKGSLQRCLIVAPLFGISLTVYELQQEYLRRK